MRNGYLQKNIVMGIVISQASNINEILIVENKSKTGAGGVEPPIFSLGGCCHIQAWPCAHIGLKVILNC